jgi:transposase-like protein
MARRGYAPEFRPRVVELVEGCRKVGDVAADLGISEQTIYAWRRQVCIDAGREVGLSTSEQAELASGTRARPGADRFRAWLRGALDRR